MNTLTHISSRLRVVFCQQLSVNLPTWWPNNWLIGQRFCKARGRSITGPQHSRFTIGPPKFVQTTTDSRVLEWLRIHLRRRRHHRRQIRTKRACHGAGKGRHGDSQCSSRWLHAVPPDLWPAHRRTYCIAWAFCDEYIVGNLVGVYRLYVRQLVES